MGLRVQVGAVLPQATARDRDSSRENH